MARHAAQKAAVDEFFQTWFKRDDRGTLKAAWRTFGPTDEFEEMLDEHLTKLIKRHLAGSERGAPARPIEWAASSPFRGLEAFEMEHTPIFFGRA